MACRLPHLHLRQARSEQPAALSVSLPAAARLFAMMCPLLIELPSLLTFPCQGQDHSHRAGISCRRKCRHVFVNDCSRHPYALQWADMFPDLDVGLLKQT